MKTVIAVSLFFGWVAAKFMCERVNDYDRGYEEGMLAGHLRGVIEGIDVGHFRGLEEGKTVTVCKGYDDGVIDGYGEGFFAGVHKGFECKMQQIDAFTFEC